MFAVDTFIDTVQGAKKQFVTTFVTDKELQKPLFAFVDTQTAFVKQVVETNKVFFCTLNGVDECIYCEHVYLLRRFK